MSRPARRSKGQNLTEYAVVLAVIAVVSFVGINFARDSFRTLYVAHHEPLNASSAQLAMTSTPDASIPTATPIPPTPTGVLSTSTPIPTLTPTPTPEATATPVPTVLATQPPTTTPLPTAAPPTAASQPTATPVPPTPTPTPTTPTLPDCDDVPWYYAWFGWCQ